MKTITQNTIQDAWRRAFRFIRKKGQKIKDNEEELIEALNLFLIINNPEEEKLVTESQKDIQHWMHENFNEIKKIPEIGNSWSYAWRLYDYQGVDQINWIIEKLKSKPESKSATITMLQKAGEESYVPCISLLDFKIRDNALWLTVTCRSLDFGRKAIYNFYNLAELAKKVANEINLKNIKLFIHAISAHIYKEDWNLDV